MLGALQHAPFEPIEAVELKWLSLKTALLLAVCSAKRIGELHALSVHQECCKLLPGNAGVILRPNPAFLPKVLSDANLNQTIELSPWPPSQEDEGTGHQASAICPVRALLGYIKCPGLSCALGAQDRPAVCMLQGGALGRTAVKVKTVQMGCRGHPTGLHRNRRANSTRAPCSLSKGRSNLMGVVARSFSTGDLQSGHLVNTLNLCKVLFS